jgi:hypothetical protein
VRPVRSLRLDGAELPLLLAQGVRTPLDELTNFLFGVYDAFRPLIDFYEKNIEPIEEDIEDAINAVDDALFAGIFQQLDATAKLAATTLLTAAAAGLTKGSTSSA